MSIAARLRKAESDLAAGDFEDALIQSLIAVAAMSKLRYPNTKDEFLRKIQPNVSIIGGFLQVQIGGAMLTIEEVLYKHVRCHLVHEAQLSPELCFVGPDTGFSISYTNFKSKMQSRRRGLRRRRHTTSMLRSRRRSNEEGALIWNWY
ncbi:MAG: hypothetical protein WA140_07805 [Geobacteraceae bacterium]